MESIVPYRLLLAGPSAARLRKSNLRRATAILIFFLSFYFNSSFAIVETIKTGSFIINMGITPQTKVNGLKPYGLVYEMLKTYRVPVKWIITPGKVKDGADFTHNGITYKGGTFIIPVEYRTTAVNTAITAWQSDGVVGATSVSDFTAEVFLTMRFVPNWTMDKDKGSIITSFFDNADIPSSAYGGSSNDNWKDPSGLNNCDDIFVLPHADPTWATHNYLYTWNRTLKGNIWSGCHGVSVLESLKDPGGTMQMNFLTTTGMVLYGDHADGSIPYTHFYPEDPIMQFIGTIDGATRGGSEQIYMPLKSGGGVWRPGVKLLVTDPDHSQIPTKSQGPAAPMVYGRGFDNSDYGYVMYEGGHDLDGSGSTAEKVAAQRAFF